MTIKPKAPRWYAYKDGVIEPCYELPKKSGSGMKAYTLREARELKLLPSVTSVLSVIDKPELDNWRVSQAIHSALTLPRELESFDSWRDRRINNMQFGYSTSVGQTLEHAYHDLPKFIESEDAFAERVLEDAEAQATKAAEFGTRIHDAIAGYLGNFWMDTRVIPEDVFPYLQGFRDWAHENIEEVHAVEKCVGHPSVGVAGRMDLECTLKGVGRCVVDFKTQNIRDGKAQFWKDWGVQLAAYSMCLSYLDDGNMSRRGLVSVVIPSNEPGPVSVKVHDDTHSLCQIFNHALELWIYTRGAGYDPRQ